MSYPKARFGTCSKCGRTTFISTHHRFKQKIWRRKLYGDLLDDSKNCVYDLCNDKCHPEADSLDTLNELEFCEMMDIDPRSKVSGGKL